MSPTFLHCPCTFSWNVRGVAIVRLIHPRSWNITISLLNYLYCLLRSISSSFIEMPTDRFGPHPCHMEFHWCARRDWPCVMWLAMWMVVGETTQLHALNGAVRVWHAAASSEVCIVFLLRASSCFSRRLVNLSPYARKINWCTADFFSSSSLDGCTLGHRMLT